MRPVDADALKEEVNKKKVVGRFNTLLLIDNAPTIPLLDFKDGYRQAIIDGKTNYSRPRGKWIAREDMDYIDENKVVHKHFECIECGLVHDFIDGHTSQYNFCPQCGAQM